MEYDEIKLTGNESIKKLNELLEKAEKFKFKGSSAGYSSGLDVKKLLLNPSNYILIIPKQSEKDKLKEILKTGWIRDNDNKEGGELIITFNGLEYRTDYGNISKNDLLINYHSVTREQALGLDDES